MEGTPDWVVEIDEKLDTFCPDPRPKQKEKAFFRLPSVFREGRDKDFYIPKKISFGPYHHSHPVGEPEKERFLLSYLKRVSNKFGYRSNKVFEKHVKAVFPIVEELRNAYDELGSVWDDENNKYGFLKMMVVDGCCVLEILHKMVMRAFEPEEMNTYKRDLLLLENQIPLKLLTELNAFNAKDPFTEVNIYEEVEMAFGIDANYFSPTYLENHILEVYRNLFLFWEPGRLGPYKEESLDFTIPSATNLQDARIEIEISRYNRVILGKLGTIYLLVKILILMAKMLFNRLKEKKSKISFSGKKLMLPHVTMDDATKSVYMNVTMMEMYNQSVGKHFSSYIYFMSFLLYNPADSKLLIDRHIINTAWEPREVTELYRQVCRRMQFNGLTKEIGTELLNLGKMLKKRYDKNSKPWRKDLFDKYLRSPWAIISVIAVLLSLSLSAAQAIYTILSYYGNPKN